MAAIAGKTMASAVKLTAKRTIHLSWSRSGVPSNTALRRTDQAY
jgi:hypothetical protein